MRALLARGSWPVSSPLAAAVDTVTEVLALAVSSAPLVTVHTERSRPDACWVGVVRRVGRRRVHLQAIDSRARWIPDTISFRLDEISRVDFGGGYEEALALASPPPRDVG